MIFKSRVRYYDVMGYISVFFLPAERMWELEDFTEIRRWYALHLLLCVTFFISGVIINFIQFVLYVTLRPFNKSLYCQINYYLMYSLMSRELHTFLLLNPLLIQSLFLLSFYLFSSSSQVASPFYLVPGLNHSSLIFYCVFLSEVRLFLKLSHQLHCR